MHKADLGRLRADASCKQRDLRLEGRGRGCNTLQCMGRSRLARLVPLAVGTALLVLLAILGTLQYRWIGQVSILESQRLRAALFSAGAAFAEDFDHEVTRAFVLFRPPAPAAEAAAPMAMSVPEVAAAPVAPAAQALAAAGPDAQLAARVARQYAAWRAEAPFPELIRDIFYVDVDPGAVGGAAGGAANAPALAILQGSPPRFVAAAWPPELADLRRRLGRLGQLGDRGGDGGGRGGAFLPPVAPDVPGLLIPAWWRAAGGAVDAGGRRPAPLPGGYLIVRFDAAAISSEILPELTRRHFGSLKGLHDAVAVVENTESAGSAENAERVAGVASGASVPGSDANVSGAAGAHPRPHVVFLSDATLPADDVRAGDLALPMFAVRHVTDHGTAAAVAESGVPPRHQPPPAAADALHGTPPVAAHHGERHRDPGAGHMRADGMDQLFGGPQGPPGQGQGPQGQRGPRGAWTLVVRRRGGSLDEMVAAFRRRNLAIGAGIVALAAVTTALMTIATQRAQRLARQQMEFVAAVTHELNTPLTAIRSAGQNLADGVVAEPAQVRRYGDLILGEGRRLSRLVSQVLDYAGIESGRQAYALQPTAVGEAVAGALEDCRALLAERRARVESDLDPRLPAVVADPAALRRALRNLVENAAKYGGPDPWIGILARHAGGEVAITVEDHGPGIRREDLPHLFEPFFRSRQAGADTPPGSGLGLSVVSRIARAHRGRVTCASGGGRRGSAFTLHLPAAVEKPT